MIETCEVQELPARARPGPGGSERTYLLTGGIARCGVCSSALEAKPAATPHECARCARPIRGIRLADLAGDVKCEGCGHKLEPKPSRPGTRGYACVKPGGCGKVRIAAEGLDRDVEQKVLARYARPENLRILTAQVIASAQTGRALAVDIGETQERIRELSRKNARGQLGDTAFETLEQELEAKLRDLRRQASVTTVIESFDASIATVDALADWWEHSSTVQERHDLVRVLLDEVRILPSRRRGFRGFDEERVVYVWAGD